MPAIMLSPHFALSEFLVSETAAREGIKNIPSPTDVEHLKRTAALLEKVRLLCGEKPIVITSGYRCLELNRAIGSSDTSQHVPGQAADFTCAGYGTPLEICKAIEASDIKFDQLIHEYDSWVHISWSETPRRQCLTINNGGTYSGLA